MCDITQSTCLQGLHHPLMNTTMPPYQGIVLQSNFLLLFDIKSFKYSGSFYSCKGRANQRKLIIEPLHEVFASILISSIIIGTEALLFEIFFSHRRACCYSVWSERAIWWNTHTPQLRKKWKDTEPSSKE